MKLRQLAVCYNLKLPKGDADVFLDLFHAVKPIFRL